MRDVSLLAAPALFLSLLALNAALGSALLGIGALVLFPWLAFRLVQFLRTTLS